MERRKPISQSSSESNPLQAEGFDEQQNQQVEAPHEENRRNPLPLSGVLRSMRNVLPAHVKVEDDCKEFVLSCVVEFIGFITREANSQCTRELRKIITADDLIRAMAKLGFKQHSELATIYLQRYRQQEGGASNQVPQQRTGPVPILPRIANDAVQMPPPTMLPMNNLMPPPAPITNQFPMNNVMPPPAPLANYQFQMNNLMLPPAPITNQFQMNNAMPTPAPIVNQFSMNSIMPPPAPLANQFQMNNVMPTQAPLANQFQMNNVMPTPAPLANQFQMNDVIPTPAPLANQFQMSNVMPPSAPITDQFSMNNVMPPPAPTIANQFPVNNFMPPPAPMDNQFPMNDFMSTPAPVVDPNSFPVSTQRSPLPLDQIHPFPFEFPTMDGGFHGDESSGVTGGAGNASATDDVQNEPDVNLDPIGYLNHLSSF